jgi:hypothetical protein
MTALAAKFRHVLSALALFALTVTTCSGMAQQPNSVDPTASAVKEEQLLQRFKTIQGRGSIPDVKSYTIEQPAGHDWRRFHEVTLRIIGAAAIIGMLVLLVVFYLARGMVRIESGRSGRTIVRFNAAEPRTAVLNQPAGSGCRGAAELSASELGDNKSPGGAVLFPVYRKPNLYYQAAKETVGF